MKRQLRSELLKLRTTRTTMGMAAAMLGIVVVAIALHSFGLPAERITSPADQLGVFIGVGGNLGSLFAALFGAMAITGEVRYGTIRPTLLATPQRGRVMAAKSLVALVAGVGFGVLATALGAAAGTLFLGLRGVSVDVSAGDYALLVAGGAAAASLWSVIGLGVGSIVRSQVPTVVGIFVWVLFVENVLITSIPSVGKFSPGALGRALAGGTEGTLQTPALGLGLLVVYAGAVFVAGWLATTRRDFT